MHTKTMLLGVVVAAATAIAPATASADDGAISRATIHDDMRAYYGGERTSAYVVTALGAVAAGAGGYLVTRDGDFERGLGWPLLGLGALEVIGGIGYALQVTGEIDHYEAALAKDPAAFRAEESAHMQGTTSRFVYYRLTELALFVAGAAVATYGFVANKDAWKGAGIGMAAIAVPFLVIDTVNDARARSYEDHLARFDPGVALQVGSGVRPWSISVGGRF